MNGWCKLYIYWACGAGVALMDGICHPVRVPFDSISEMV